MKRVLLSACLLVSSVTAVLGARLALAEALSSAERIGSEAMRLTGARSVRLRPVADGVFSGVDGLSEWVDALTGEEYGWSRNGQYIFRYADPRAYAPPVGSSDIGESRAKAIAAAWANRAYAGGSLAGMAVSCTCKEEGTDPVTAEYLVEYRRYAGTVRTCDHIAIRVNGSSGAVMSVEQDYDVISVGLSPQVGSDEARSIAARELGVPVECCTAYNLEVVKSLQGVQHLVWVVQARTGDEEVGGEGVEVVDAHSGKALDSGKSW
ncbi:hypothetical protein MX659_03135 [Coriobacteriia bacterium Es71-Z0120]|uniref:hypothetical protein n=1 Tax=Parvivirga hydrogeniphila TaxID=2939460 RepID=UPI0022608662|nr:hypothetical protein [Parvivirga hydrogeniphila]MCL4078595.1 hypothetical protein [Parvivirga hydrogeniphila]